MLCEESEEFYRYEQMINSLTFYHGTSSAIGARTVILPSDTTGVLRESFRSGMRNVVFLTTSKLSAIKYARKACALFGGTPVVYEVKPDPLSISHRMDNEYTCDYALVIREVSILKAVETSDKEHAALIRQKLSENGGFCPCQLTKSQDTKCMCKDFRDQIKRGETGACHCGLYVAQ